MSQSDDQVVLGGQKTTLGLRFLSKRSWIYVIVILLSPSDGVSSRVFALTGLLHPLSKFIINFPMLVL